MQLLVFSLYIQRGPEVWEHEWKCIYFYLHCGLSLLYQAKRYFIASFLQTWIHLQWAKDARKPWQQTWTILTHLLFLPVQLVGAEWVGWGWLSGCWDAMNLLHWHTTLHLSVRERALNACISSHYPRGGALLMHPLTSGMSYAVCVPFCSISVCLSHCWCLRILYSETIWCTFYLPFVF